MAMDEGVGVVMMGLRLPEDYPARSLLGGRPPTMTAREQWALRMEAAKERKAQRALDMSREVGGNDED
jgi:hypothetical protein